MSYCALNGPIDYGYGVQRFREQAHDRMWAAAKLACDDARSGNLGLR
jgi:hypothetical protein